MVVSIEYFADMQVEINMINSNDNVITGLGLKTLVYGLNHFIVVVKSEDLTVSKTFNI